MVVGVEVSAEVVGIAEVEEVVVEVQTRVKVRTTRAVSRLGVVIRAPSTRTCRQESGQGARTTSDTGNRHFSVPNPPPAHGKISIQQDLINETVTSSAARIQLY